MSKLPGLMLLSVYALLGAQVSPTVKSVKLEVQVDDSSPCKLSLSATIEGSGKGTVWYRFLGPEGVTFDFGAEDKMALDISTWGGVGKGATMPQDIKGEFKVEAAMLGPGGKRGPVTVSNIVPAAYTCAGSTVAKSTGSAAAPAAAGKVTAVRLRLEPERYSGPCPGKVRLVGEITADGPGTAWYQFLAGAVSSSPEGTVKFEAAGTQTVAIDGSFRSAPRVPHASMIAIMMEAGGTRGYQNVSSGPVNYNITCVSQPPARK